MDRLRLDLPAPVNMIASRAVHAWRRSAPLRALRAHAAASAGTPAAARSLCTVNPATAPACTANPAVCAWFSALASALLPPPAHARARQSSGDAPGDSPLDSLLHELHDQAQPGADADAAPKPARHRAPATAHPAADRVVAIGDVHGDVDALRVALRSAAVIDESDGWIGGQTVLVQVGDQLDRGERERDIYSLLFRLQDVAPAAGGAVHILLGNHELMNASLDFRYVTRGGFEDFTRGDSPAAAKQRKADKAGAKAPAPMPAHIVRRRPAARIPSTETRSIRQLPGEMRARAKAIASGGHLAAELAERAAVSVIVGDSLFVHAGFAPRHLRVADDTGAGGSPPPDGQGRGGAKTVARSPLAGRIPDAVRMMDFLNVQTRRFLRGEGTLPPVLRRGDGPVWMRDYSRPGVRSGSAECRMLSDTLRLAGVKRMVVGHTPQAQGINSACGGKVWRIDTGMSKAYGGVPEAIEINRRGGVKVYTPGGVVQGSARFK